MWVLLTRPGADSRRLAVRLGACGVQSLIWPMTRIVPTDWRPELPPSTDAVVFTSANAVAAFVEHVRDRGLPAYCVGDRTAEAAREAGFERVESAAGNLAALAELLRRRPFRALFYPSGRDVSADLGAALTGSDIMVDRRIVYAAEPGGPPPEAVHSALLAGEIGLVTIWSRRAAAILADRLAELGNVALERTDLLAISANAAAPLESVGFRRITVAPRPEAEAMIVTITAAARQFSG